MGSRLFEDHEHAKLYNAFRPTPPPEIISRILCYIGPTLPLCRAVDVGCGTGQSTVVLSPYFKQVIGFDISEAQIAEAKANRKLSNTEYKVAPAEALPVDNESVELVTTVSSFHWFDQQKFLAEAKRILVPSGVLAVVAGRRFLPTSEKKPTNQMLLDFSRKVYCDVLMPYMADEIDLVRNELRDLDFPFDDIERESGIHTKLKATAADFPGYISSTSFYQEMKKADPVKARTLMEFIELRCVCEYYFI